MSSNGSSNGKHQVQSLIKPDSYSALLMCGYCTKPTQHTFDDVLPIVVNVKEGPDYYKLRYSCSKCATQRVWGTYVDKP